MTIRVSREDQIAFDNLEACDEHAPAGMYSQAKAVRSLIGETVDELLRHLNLLGLKAPNCDPIRDVEIMLWNYVRSANKDMAATAEGFGAACLHGPETRQKVIAQAERDRDFLRAKGVV